MDQYSRLAKQVLKMRFEMSQQFQEQEFEAFNTFCANEFHSAEWKSLHSFGYFSKFPPEIKIIIWAFAADIPQLVRIACDDPDEEPIYRAEAKIPAVLHVCRDSRIQALKKYTLMFEGVVRSPVYFNHKMDYLVMVGSHTTDYFLAMSQDAHLRTSLEGVENVVAMIPGLASGVSEQDSMIAVGKVFGGVKRMVILEQTATWWGKYKEIWSDEEMRKIFQKLRRERRFSANLLTTAPPEVRIVKLSDILERIRYALDSQQKTDLMLRCFGSFFEEGSTYNVKEAPKTKEAT